MDIYGIYKNSTDEPICRAGIETQRTNIWIPREEEEV